MLTSREQERYDRQIMIGEIGREGQEKLKRSRVVIAGTGGLGSPIAIYLVAAGIGMIRIIDHDQVVLSNLNRQILHWEEIELSRRDRGNPRNHHRKQRFHTDGWL
jgi:molybdopterin/thiamine biosynthesis adenylyltransferase